MLDYSRTVTQVINIATCLTLRASCKIVTIIMKAPARLRWLCIVFVFVCYLLDNVCHVYVYLYCGTYSLLSLYNLPGATSILCIFVQGVSVVWGWFHAICQKIDLKCSRLLYFLHL